MEEDPLRTGKVHVRMGKVTLTLEKVTPTVEKVTPTVEVATLPAEAVTPTVEKVTPSAEVVTLRGGREKRAPARVLATVCWWVPADTMRSVSFCRPLRGLGSFG